MFSSLGPGLCRRQRSVSSLSTSCSSILKRRIRSLVIPLSLLCPLTVYAVPTGIVGWWKAEGNANDSAGSNNGALLGGVAFGSGKVGQAFSLNGSTAYVDVGNASPLHVSSGDFTVTTWVYFNTLGTDMAIVDKMDPGLVNGDGWRLLKQDNQRFWFCFGIAPNNGCYPGGNTTVMSNTQASPGVWYHVAAVKTSGTLYMYVNGNLESTTALGPFTDTNSANMRIGSNAREGRFLDGLIDEVQLYNRALTDSEIQSLAAGPYAFMGFLQPVDNLPTVNTVKAGSAIPVKFSLNGNKGLNIIEQGYPASQAADCSTSAPTDAIEQTVNAGGSSLSYDPVSDQYTYVWKTEKSWVGCRQFNLRLTDGTDHKALFIFGK